MSKISFDQAASIPLSSTFALQIITKAQIQKSWNILISGAGGAIGYWLIQLLKTTGAYVTALTSSDKPNILTKLGADQVGNFKNKEIALHGDEAKLYDCLIDLASVGETLFPYLKLGAQVIVIDRELTSDDIKKKNLQIRLLQVEPSAQNLEYIGGLIETKVLQIPSIKCYEFIDVMHALEVQRTGKFSGKLVIKIEPAAIEKALGEISTKTHGRSSVRKTEKNDKKRANSKDNAKKNIDLIGTEAEDDNVSEDSRTRAESRDEKMSETSMVIKENKTHKHEGNIARLERKNTIETMSMPNSSPVSKSRQATDRDRGPQ